MSTYTVEDRDEEILIEVGEPHPWAGSLDKTYLGLTEGMKVVCDDSGVKILLVLSGDPERDARLLKSNPLRFGLLRMRGGYCWVMNCGVGCFEAPYSPCIVPGGPSDLPWIDACPTPDSRALLSIHVIDRKGILRLLNAVTVSPAFTVKLESLHAEAVALGRISTSSWDAEIARHEACYPTPNAALRQALVTSKGGA